MLYKKLETTTDLDALTYAQTKAYANAMRYYKMQVDWNVVRTLRALMVEDTGEILIYEVHNDIFRAEYAGAEYTSLNENDICKWLSKQSTL